MNSPKISPAPHQCHPNLNPTMQPHTCSPQLSKPKVMKNKKSEESDDNNIKRDQDIYDKLDETQDFKVADGVVFFMRTFGYFGSLISYNLRNNEDIKACIAAAYSSIGALKEIWSNPHLDTYNKYLLFRAIPMNLLLWGCETWSLRQSLLDKLEVFLHKSIRCILKISMSRVINKKLRNEQVRTSFYTMPCVRNMIAARQLGYIGKLIQGPHDQPARRRLRHVAMKLDELEDHKRLKRTALSRTYASYSKMSY